VMWRRGTEENELVTALVAALRVAVG